MKNPTNHARNRKRAVLVKLIYIQNVEGEDLKQKVTKIFLRHTLKNPSRIETSLYIVYMMLVNVNRECRIQ